MHKHQLHLLNVHFRLNRVVCNNLIIMASDFFKDILKQIEVQGNQTEKSVTLDSHIHMI